MDVLYQEQVLFGARGSLQPSVDEAQRTLDLLENARQSLETGVGNGAITLAKLQTPIKQSLDSINGNLKDVHKASTTYSKALDKRLKSKPAASAEESELSSDIFLDRAIGMHLLREGQFGVATAFMDELSHNDRDFAAIDRQQSSDGPPALKANFEQMYFILQEMRVARNLAPAMDWARSRSKALQDRGSDLEFDLTKLQFIWLFAGPTEPPMNYSQRLFKAMMYAREALSRFESRYLPQIEELLGAMAFCANTGQSPYRSVFESAGAWNEVALSFTREFCSLLGLSADSPLFIATTAGAMALPRLDKLQALMRTKRTEWTTKHELPVEVPLPPTYRYHNIFVCPVSKEIATDANPPMLLPCCHVIARESLERMSKLGKFRCSYCPRESHYNQAKRVFL